MLEVPPGSPNRTIYPLIPIPADLWTRWKPKAFCRHQNSHIPIPALDGAGGTCVPGGLSDDWDSLDYDYVQQLRRTIL